MKFEIVWPERRYVSAQQIRGWYADALANGETDVIIPDCDEGAEQMARELNSIGHITLGRGRR